MEGNIPAGGPAGSPSDDELLAAARQGDASALEALLVRYQPRLYRFGLRMCGNVDEAGDVAQESLIAMARSLRDFRGDASVSSCSTRSRAGSALESGAGASSRQRMRSRWTRQEAKPSSA